MLPLLNDIPEIDKSLRKERLYDKKAAREIRGILWKMKSCCKEALLHFVLTSRL